MKIKLRAERKAGDMLAEMDIKPGKPTNANGPMLEPLGISKKQSSRWQAIAKVPTVEFEDYIEATRGANRELSSAASWQHDRAATRKLKLG